MRNSEPLRIGGNSRFRSVLNVGGIRNSEPLRIGENSQFCSVLNVGGIRNSEPLRIGTNILYRAEDFCTSEQIEQLFLLFEALLLDSEQTVQIVLGINWKFCFSVETAPFI